MDYSITPKDMLRDVASALKECNNEPECPVKHHFSDGVYMREITMPKDSLILGKVHKTTHLNIISKGKCVLIDMVNGDKTYIEAPYTFESKGGVSKLLYIVEETVWSTVHITDLKDPIEIENKVVEKDTHGILCSRSSSSLSSR